MGAGSSSATAWVNDVRMFCPTSVLPVKKVIVPSVAICSHASRLAGRDWPLGRPLFSPVSACALARPNAGPNQNVTTGITVQLDGGGSTDADNDPLTYSWSIIGRPTNSNALITTPNIAQPTFVPDLAGTYIVQLIVNDGFVNSQPVTVTITAVNTD